MLKDILNLDTVDILLDYEEIEIIEENNYE